MYPREYLKSMFTQASRMALTETLDRPDRFPRVVQHYASGARRARRELNRKHGARQVRLMLKKQTRKQFEETLERRQKLDALIRRTRVFSFQVKVKGKVAA